MSTAAHRVAQRFITTVVTNRVPVILADGGTVTSKDIVRLLRLRGVALHDVVFYQVLPDDLPNVVRWDGTDHNGRLVHGQLLLHLGHDAHHVVVTGEIVLISGVAAGERAKDPKSEPMLTAKQRLLTIATVGRLAIEDLRTNPDNLRPVLLHLADIVDLAEQFGWSGDSW